MLKPQSKMRLVIQIPCFNEEKNIADTLNAIPSEIDGVDEIIKLVIDDGSTDQTKLNKMVPTFVVKLCQNMGLAKAFQAGITESLKLGADIVVNTDGDNQYNADDMKHLIDPIILVQILLLVVTYKESYRIF